MALHTDTQIYGACIELFGAAVDVILNMRRDVKHTLGGKIIDACTDLDKHIRRANMASDKVPHIEALLERLEEVEFVTRMCRDRRFIPTTGYAKLILRTQSIGKQANGWKKLEMAKRQEQPGLFQYRQGDPGRA